MNPNYTKLLRPVVALGLILGLSACASNDRNVYNFPETATRAAPVATTLNAPTSGVVPFALPSLHVVEVNVTVPETLTVSEANRFLPRGDIVWREDPIGNRYQQVKTIMTDALTQGVAGFDGERAVALDVVVTKFHALTEKARYTVGGVHAIQFHLTIRDAVSGEMISTRHIKADFDGLGGKAARAAEARGITQKVRINQHLSHVIQQELGKPGGYAERDTGFIGAINQI